jgi:hypothetical protein
MPERVADRRLELAVRLRDGDRVASGIITRVVAAVAFLHNAGVGQPG